MYVCVGVYLCSVFMNVLCMYCVCMNARMYLPVCIYVHIFHVIFQEVCMYICIYICMYGCVVFMCACIMYVGMYYVCVNA